MVAPEHKLPSLTLYRSQVSSMSTVEENRKYEAAMTPFRELAKLGATAVAMKQDGLWMLKNLLRTQERIAVAEPSPKPIPFGSIEINGIVVTAEENVEFKNLR